LRDLRRSWGVNSNRGVGGQRRRVQRVQSIRTVV
jgi:hypothetical protein